MPSRTGYPVLVSSTSNQHQHLSNITDSCTTLATVHQNNPSFTYISLPMNSSSESDSANTANESPIPTADQSRIVALSMPPPAHAVIIAPPPQATYTLKQVLDFPLQTPSPPSGISVGILAAHANRPTHVSSARAMNYEPIVPRNLRPIPGLEITEFRNRVKSLDSIRFAHSMSIPWEASPMLSEACVTGYLDAQVLGAAWQAVLQILPHERNYDLQMVKQLAAEHGIPDQTYSILRGDTCKTLAVVELKSTGVVQSMLHVIGSVTRGLLLDATDDWDAVTRQLRMYAVICNTPDVLVLDEGVGIYFRFPKNPTDENGFLDYLYASTEMGQSFVGELRLSLRELVVFVLFSAFESHGVELLDLEAEAPRTILVGPNTRPYRNVLPTPESSPASNKRTRSSSGQGHQPSKRAMRDELAPQASLDRLVVGATLKLELVPGLSPRWPRASSPDSGFHEGSVCSPKTIVRPPLSDHEPPTIATVTVERLLKQNVALVTDGNTRFIAKLFPPDSNDYPDQMLMRELAVYRECADLQGGYLPYLHGVYRAVRRGSRFSSPIMLTEFVGTGKTVTEVVTLAGVLDDDDELDAAEGTLKVLQERALDAITVMHQRKIVHSDLVGDNMLVVDDDHVVLVDFGFSRVLKDEARRFKNRSEDDLRRLKRAFEVQYD